MSFYEPSYFYEPRLRVIFKNSFIHASHITIIISQRTMNLVQSNSTVLLTKRRIDCYNSVINAVNSTLNASYLLPVCYSIAAVADWTIGVRASLGGPVCQWMNVRLSWGRWACNCSFILYTNCSGRILPAIHKNGILRY